MKLFKSRFCFLFTGSHILLEKLRKYKPKIAVFNGKLIYEVFSGKKDFGFGRQPNLVEGTNTVRENTGIDFETNEKKKKRKKKTRFHILA